MSAERDDIFSKVDFAPNGVKAAEENKLFLAAFPKSKALFSNMILKGCNGCPMTDNSRTFKIFTLKLISGISPSEIFLCSIGIAAFVFNH